MSHKSFHTSRSLITQTSKQAAAREKAKWQRLPTTNPYLKRTPPMANVVDEVARAALLKDAAKAAKLKDVDLLVIAKRGLSPVDAIADLKARYPAAFEAEPMKLYPEMTAAEKAAFHRKHGLPQGSGR